MSNITLETKKIFKSYSTPNGGKIDVLRGIDFSIKRGESLSLRGESGAGKTTFMNIAACLEKSDSGEVFWNGERIDTKSSSKQASIRSRYMGFVFQSYCLVPELNVLENVLMPVRIAGFSVSKYKSRAKDILEKVGLKDRIKHHTWQLSGGESQRVAIARAIVNNPSLILADEPTGNLDEKTGDEVMNLFLDISKSENASVFLITHNADYSKRTDKSLTIRAGLMC